MSTQRQVLLFGALGRMGSELRRLLAESDALQFAAGVVSEADLGNCPTSEEQFVSRWQDVTVKVDAVLDLSLPEGTSRAIEAARQYRCPFVTGVTALNEIQREDIEELGQVVPVLVANNFSLGMNALWMLAEQAAALFPASEYDVEVLELHHRHKKDAPSGSAVELARRLSEKSSTERRIVLDRSASREERVTGDIGMQALRGGDVTGEHTVYFFGEGERFELSHRLTDRSVLARGALKALEWLCEQSRGYYSMQDVLRGAVF